jgi:hypothetical protein
MNEHHPHLIHTILSILSGGESIKGPFTLKTLIILILGLFSKNPILIHIAPSNTKKTYKYLI